jgi:16S rRNA (cytidine1402-2'-O)-methyltransferase
VRALRDFVVENAKSARAFLGALGMPVRELSISTVDGDPAALLRPLREKRSLGLLSEAGCPAIADPGAALIEAAHREGFQVVPLVGPSSIVLALMASGLEGQRFAFCGYLPREDAERKKRIHELELRSRREKETEIFIETPYRNDTLLAALLESCSASTRLCVAADLTLASESILSKPIAGCPRP